MREENLTHERRSPRRLVFATGLSEHMFDAADRRPTHPTVAQAGASGVIITVHIPRFSLHIALRAARRTSEAMIALGPQPGDPLVIGECTEAAALNGVAAGLRVGEALARCPDLELVVPDPGSVAAATEQIALAIERIGADLEIVANGTFRMESRGIERLHGGLAGVIRQLKGVLPVGLDCRIGVAPTLFSSLQAANHAAPRAPLHIDAGEIADFLAPLAADHLPLDPASLAALGHLGIRTVGQFVKLPRASVVDRFGLDGLRAWHCGRGTDTERLRPRVPPQPIEASFHFPETVGALPVLHAAASLIIGELVTRARQRATAIRSVTFRAWLTDGGSWTRTVTLREATTQLDRLLIAVLPSLAEVSGPVDTLVVSVDASGAMDGRQLVFAESAANDRSHRTAEAVRQISGTYGDDAVLRLIALEPWSRLPERQWALVPYDASINRDLSV